MDLKIFNAGFTEKEFNDFCNTHIVYKYNVLDNGTVYLYYKNVNALGKRPIELCEDLDRIIKQAQTEILTHQADKESFIKEIEALKEEKSKFHSNQDEWKKLDKAISEKEFQIKMADDTIDNHEKKINVLNEKAVALLAPKA